MQKLSRKLNLKYNLIICVTLLFFDGVTDKVAKFLSFSEKIHLPGNIFTKTQAQFRKKFTFMTLSYIITSKCLLLKKFKKNALRQE